MAEHRERSKQVSGWWTTSSAHSYIENWKDNKCVYSEKPVC